MPSQGFSLKKMSQRSRMKAKEKQIAKVARKVLNEKAELKEHAYGQDTTVSTAGSLYCMTEVAQGDAYNSRDGGEISIQGMDIRYTVTYADATNQMRVIVFTWNDGATNPVTGDILQAPGSWDVLSYLDRHGDVPYKILYDRTHLVDNLANPQKNGRINLRFKNGIRCYYNGSAGTDYGKRQIWMLVISDSIASTHPAFKGTGYVYFNDF